jgi:DNA-binding transcriptional LysR family regulator
MQLTEEGEYLRASVAGPLRTLELALQNARSFASPIEGNFTIGMPSGIGEILARPLVLRMSSEFPNIRLRIVEGLTGSLADWLARGMLDFALLEDATNDDRLTDRELFSQRLMLVGGADSALAADQPLAFEKAIRLPLILPTHHLGIRGVFTDCVTRLRTVANIRFEADSCRLTKELIEAGVGYGILPLAYFRHEYDAGKLRYCGIVSPRLMLPTFLSHRTNSRSTASTVEGMVMDTITDMMTDLCKA